MYKSIMVPLDGSGFAEEALPTAIRLARASGGRLVLARVVERAVPSVLLTSALAEEAWSDAPADRAADYLEEVSDRILSRTGVHSDMVLLKGGVASSLRKEAARRKCHLIVMSTHAHGPFGRVFQSSVADKMARSAACPVLFVRAGGAKRDWNIHRRFVHILVPLDGTRASEHALRPAIEMANLDDARVTLLHVAQPQLVGAAVGTGSFQTGGEPDIDPEEAERMSRAYLHSVAELVEQQRVRPHTDVHFLIGAPAQEILDFADGHAADLVVMTTRGLGGVRRMVLGSTATSVLHHARAAVMLVPPVSKG